jgi:catechol 2,3-dioxygenase-like lactoylglutathione lyase family enzyme
MRVERLARIALNAADPEALARFFIDAFGFSRLAGNERKSQALALGPTRLDIMRATGRSYPADVPGWSPLFQHCALATANMTRAMTRLERIPGWSAISTDGPEHLPKSSGGVTAFKFRDSEGHPLEFLAFPDAPATSPLESAELFLRIDHSAISVADTRRSIVFYKNLGLNVGGRSWNVGPEQARLDAVPDARVEVTRLDLSSGAKPHVELLCYRGVFDRNVAPPGPDDVAATRLVFAVESGDALNAMAARHRDRLIRQDERSILLRDPDGHLVEVGVG